MKKVMICLAVLFVVLGLCATVFAQDNGSQAGEAMKGKICKPGAIPILSGGQTQLFEAENQFEAQCTCNQTAEHYKQYVCYATPTVTKTEIPLWYCLCSKKKTW